VGLTGSILITGGTGTLGHAICRQARREAWDARITIMARSELALSRMKNVFPEHRYVIGDVRDYQSIRTAFAGHSGIVHAAAMKRIPECEQQPDECWKTNIMGSSNVAMAATDARCEWVLGISTDKACSAITAYGASKLAMEGIFQQYWRMPGSPNMLLLRYGNVVASNGSVVPVWAGQAARGEALTITDSRMTRFWLSPSEAVELLVWRVSHVHQSGIFVPKVGAMALADLAMTLHPGNTIKEIGLRSSEKLHEDLVAPQERSRDMGFGYVIDEVGEVGTSYTSQNAQQIRIADFLEMLKDAEDLERVMAGQGGRR
jgi:UDP-N-acetylglucosamine 4,6-dehydratase